MELRHLRYFATVAQERNFTRAAALSRQVHHPQAELGIALLDRDCRPVRLTQAGRLFYEHATQVLRNPSTTRAR